MEESVSMSSSKESNTIEPVNELSSNSKKPRITIMRASTRYSIGCDHLSTAEVKLENERLKTTLYILTNKVQVLEDDFKQERIRLMAKIDPLTEKLKVKTKQYDDA